MVSRVLASYRDLAGAEIKGGDVEVFDASRRPFKVIQAVERDRPARDAEAVAHVQALALRVIADLHQQASGSTPARRLSRIQRAMFIGARLREQEFATGRGPDPFSLDTTMGDGGAR